MKTFRSAAVLAAMLSFAFAAPSHAQNDWPIDSGDFVDVGMISIDDGHDLDYAKFLAGQWRAQQEFAKSQGWITSYEILQNIDKRPGEPDLYLVERYASMPTAAEIEKRDEAYRAFFKKNDSQLDAESAERAKYRHVIGSQTLRVLRFR